MSVQKSETVNVSDQMARKIVVPDVPRRIISLVPSQTELLFDLGLNEEIVGVTKYCVHPAEAVQAKTKIGGTKRLRFEVIEELRPDLIIGNKEENDQAQLDAIFLSSEPFPFNQEHAHAFTANFPVSNVELVDGQMFSWYGSRLLLAVPYLQRLIAKMAQGLLARQ